MLGKLMLIASFAMMGGPAQAESPDVQKILSYSDRTRGGIKEGLEWMVTISSQEEGETTEREFFVKNKLNNSFVESKAPQKFKGEVFLFNGRTIWFFKAGLRKPVAISSRQKLSGMTSNGDIASTNYVRDYSATFTKMDTFNKQECYLLHLKSKAPDTTYDQIDYWIAKETGLALKAEFLALSGKALKSAFFAYDHHINYEGKKFPFVSSMKIIDSKNTSTVSKLTYSTPAIKNHPDSLFNVNNLLR
jgi:outer membrane lipoprotein-sorting protein